MLGSYTNVEADGFLMNRHAEGFPTGLVISNNRRRHWQILFTVCDHLAFLGEKNIQTEKVHFNVGGSCNCKCYQLLLLSVNHVNQYTLVRRREAKKANYSPTDFFPALTECNTNINKIH